MYRLLYWLVLQRLPAEGTHRVSFALLRALVALPGVRALLARLLAPRDPALRGDRVRARVSRAARARRRLRQGRRGRRRRCSRSASASSRSAPSPPRRSPAIPKPRLFRLPRDRALVNRMGFNNHGARRGRGSPTSRARRDGHRRRQHRQDQARRRGRRARRLRARAPSGSRRSPTTWSSTSARRTRRACATSRPSTSCARCSRPCARVRPRIADAARAAAREDRARPRRRRHRRGRRPRARARPRRHHRDEHDDRARPASRRRPRASRRSAPAGCRARRSSDRALEVLRRLRARVGDRLVLIAVGGIETADDAWARIRAGATLVQATPASSTAGRCGRAGSSAAWRPGCAPTGSGRWPRPSVRTPTGWGANGRSVTAARERKPHPDSLPPRFCVESLPSYSEVTMSARQSNRTFAALGTAVFMIACGSSTTNNQHTDAPNNGSGKNDAPSGGGSDSAASRRPVCSPTSIAPVTFGSANSVAPQPRQRSPAGTQSDRFVGFLGPTDQTGPEFNIIIFSDGSVLDTPDWPTLAMGPPATSTLSTDPTATPSPRSMATSARNGQPVTVRVDLGHAQRHGRRQRERLDVLR